MKVQTLITAGLAVGAFAAIVIAPQQAFAQAAASTQELAPVQVSGSKAVPPRVDVSRTCPDYGESLRVSLVRSLRYIDQTGDMRVVFTLKGNEVESVTTSGGPYDYRRPVKRAVRYFSCSNDGQENQSYAFDVVFRLDDDSGTGGFAAVKTLTPQAVALNR